VFVFKNHCVQVCVCVCVCVHMCYCLCALAIMLACSCMSLLPLAHHISDLGDDPCLYFSSWLDAIAMWNTAAVGNRGHSG